MFGYLDKSVLYGLYVPFLHSALFFALGMATNAFINELKWRRKIRSEYAQILLQYGEDEADKLWEKRYRQRKNYYKRKLLWFL